MSSETQAKNLYKEFFTRYPGVRNPTDLNDSRKYCYAMDIGYHNLRLMQSARKRANSADGVNMWVFPEYWEES